jgi:hypothetical protein
MAKITDSERKEFFDAYRDYAKDLRTWLLAFGIGAPAFFISDKFLQLQSIAGKKDEIRWIASLFLLGVVLQIMLVLINKYANYYSYAASDKPHVTPSRLSKAFQWVVDKFWIDLALDIAAIVVFSFATLKMYGLFI